MYCLQYLIWVRRSFKHFTCINSICSLAKVPLLWTILVHSDSHIVFWQTVMDKHQNKNVFLFSILTRCIENRKKSLNWWLSWNMEKSLAPFCYQQTQWSLNLQNATNCNWMMSAKRSTFRDKNVPIRFNIQLAVTIYINVLTFVISYSCWNSFGWKCYFLICNIHPHLSNKWYPVASISQYQIIS